MEGDAGWSHHPPHGNANLVLRTADLGGGRRGCFQVKAAGERTLGAAGQVRF
jgi:hypothetical protein